MNLDPVAIWEGIGIAGCLVASAFFSSSETALTSLSKPQAQNLFEEKGARSLKLWLERPIEVLTAILIGNNIFNITASALATDLANRLLSGTSASDWAIPVTVGVMTFLLLTFGEITPKAIAKRMYMTLSAPMMSLLRVPYLLFYPFTMIFSKLTQGLMRLMGNDPEEQAPFVTAEEIEYMINLGSREGTFSEDRERMLLSVFEISDTTVHEIMVPRTDAVILNTDMNLDDIVETLQRCGHSRLPVYQDGVDNIVGIFYAKDLIKLSLGDVDKSDFDIQNYLHKPFFVPSSKRLADLLSEFQRQRIHMAIVVDEFGGTDGLITLEDIIEEFFGEIQDEYDAEQEQLVPISDTLLRADARAPVYEIESYFDIKLPEDGDYETLGGFLMSESGVVPAKGDEIVWNQLVFRVVEADEKKVISVEIERDDALLSELGEQRKLVS